MKALAGSPGEPTTRDRGSPSAAGEAPGRRRGRPPRYTRRQLAEALRLAHGVQGRAARLLGCDRHTVARHVARSPELQAIAAEASEALLELAEGNVVDGVLAGDKEHTKFILATKGRHRGWSARAALTGKDGAPLAPRAEPAFDFSGLTAEERDALDALLTKLGHP